MIYTVIDDIDREIVGLLLTDARRTQRDVGAIVGLSPNAAGARMNKLFTDRVITGVRAIVDHEALGRGIEATIDIWIEDRNDTAPFVTVVRSDARIVECFHLTGPLDYRIRVRVASPADLDNLLSRLRSEGCVRQTDSRLILEQLDVNPI
ncbi:MAG: Lrp/AsnC family leucine-responsive transcriptional regulator [Candidatus Aldehydirespiratoraceae bacterium]|jgi:Lrp/AsnC family leucine-responsive transcriptional regulator